MGHTLSSKGKNQWKSLNEKLCYYFNNFFKVTTGSLFYYSSGTKILWPVNKIIIINLIETELCRFLITPLSLSLCFSFSSHSPARSAIQSTSSHANWKDLKIKLNSIKQTGSEVSLRECGLLKRVHIDWGQWKGILKKNYYE